MDVSVVVCARNEAGYIEECLKRLKYQNPKPEIIVVDGHSTDRTLNIVKKYADKILKDNKTGLADARNVGWKAASGKIIAYCDADARPEKGWVSAIIENMENVDCVSGPLETYDGGWKQKLGFRIWADLIPRVLSVVGFNNVWGSNMAFRKTVLEKEPFKSKFLEDFEIGRRIRKFGKVKFTNDIRLSVSSRRFYNSFHRTCAKFYIPAALRIIFFKDYEQTGYYSGVHK